MTTPDPVDRDAKRRKNRREWARVMNLSVIGMVFPIGLLLGYFVGRWIGGLFGNESLGAIIGALFGLASGFRNLFVMVERYGSPRKSDDDEE